MCGRFVQFSSIRTLESYFPLQEIRVTPQASYNIAPTQSVAAIIKEDRYCLDTLNWGLVPFWAKDTSAAFRMINARAETVSSKPSFRAAFKKRRCLILADGFFEWTGAKGNKQPWFLRLAYGRPFAFAGLFEIWKSQQALDGDSDYRSVTIITRAASASVQQIHHRMPVILSPDAYRRWLNPLEQDPGPLNRIIEDECITDLEAYPVSKAVNHVKNNSAVCIERLRRERDQG